MSHAAIVERSALDVETHILRENIGRQMQFVWQEHFEPANLLRRHGVRYNVEFAAAETFERGRRILCGCKVDRFDRNLVDSKEEGIFLQANMVVRDPLL